MRVICAAMVMFTSICSYSKEVSLTMDIEMHHGQVHVNNYEEMYVTEASTSSYPEADAVYYHINTEAKKSPVKHVFDLQENKTYNIYIKTKQGNWWHTEPFSHEFVEGGAFHISGIGVPAVLAANGKRVGGFYSVQGWPAVMFACGGAALAGGDVSCALELASGKQLVFNGFAIGLTFGGGVGGGAVNIPAICQYIKEGRNNTGDFGMPFGSVIFYEYLNVRGPENDYLGGGHLAGFFGLGTGLISGYFTDTSGCN